MASFENSGRDERLEAGEHFVAGVKAFELGKVSEGLEHLREAHRLDTDNVDVLGHMAWACIGIGAGAEAVEYYDRLIRLNPDADEPPLRRLQAIMVRDGYRSETLRDMVKIARAAGMPPYLWLELGKLAETHGDSRSARAIYNEAVRRYPDDTRLTLRRLEHSRQGGRQMLLRVLNALQIERFFRLLLKSAAFRRLLRESTDSPSDYLYSSLMDFYRAGSTESHFPQSPPELLPENFARHMAVCECSWFEWFKKRSPHTQGTGLRLVDVGCGPGFLGHHFVHYGYNVTAVSGSPEELAECSRRGMTTVECEMHQMPLPSGEFDAILASHVLEHSVAPMLLLWEMKRLLKPEGIFYINLPLPIDAEPRRDYPEYHVPETDSYIMEVDESHRTTVPELAHYAYGFPAHIFVLTYWQWRWVFRQAGLEHLDSCIEFPDGRQVDPNAALEELAGRPHHCNQFFLLRKPAA